MGSGKWLSRYDNKTITISSKLDIDHLVPLKEAWESGASFWSSKERTAFANDLSFAGSLIAVPASTNRAKADRDPSTWLPANVSFRCTYAVTWVQVKYRWSLSIDESEFKALRTQLATCPKSKKYPLPSKFPLVISASESPLPAPTATLTATPASTPSPSEGTPSYKLITPGAFCTKSEEGDFGKSSTGVIYQCKTSISKNMLRWRR